MRGVRCALAHPIELLLGGLRIHLPARRHRPRRRVVTSWRRRPVPDLHEGGPRWRRQLLLLLQPHGLRRARPERSDVVLGVDLHGAQLLHHAQALALPRAHQLLLLNAQAQRVHARGAGQRLRGGGVLRARGRSDGGDE